MFSLGTIRLNIQREASVTVFNKVADQQQLGILRKTPRKVTCLI